MKLQGPASLSPGEQANYSDDTYLDRGRHPIRSEPGVTARRAGASGLVPTPTQAGDGLAARLSLNIRVEPTWSAGRVQ